MDPDPSTPPKQSLGSQFIEFIQTLIVFAAIGTVIYVFIAQPHKVSGSSMYPNFHDGDYIITDKISYDFEKPERGQIIVFKYPLDETQDFIKRIIGLPGEKIKVQGGHVYINDKLLQEPYLSPSVQTNDGSFLQEGKDVTIPADHYIAMGDNRQYSLDSREWGFLTRQEIIGRVFLRYWPENEIGVNPANYTSYNLQ